MPEDTLSGLKHLRFTAKTDSLKHAGTGRGAFRRFQRADRAQQVNYLKRQLEPVDVRFAQIQKEREERALTPDFGLILNVASEPGYPLKYGSLEKASNGKTLGIVLLNVRHQQTDRGEVTQAAIFVPHGQLKELEKKVADYADPSKDRKTEEGKSPVLGMRIF